MRASGDASVGQTSTGISMSMGSTDSGLGNGRSPWAMGRALSAMRAIAEALVCTHLLPSPLSLEWLCLQMLNELLLLRLTTSATCFRMIAEHGIQLLLPYMREPPCRCVACQSPKHIW